MDADLLRSDSCAGQLADGTVVQLLVSAVWSVFETHDRTKESSAYKAGR